MRTFIGLLRTLEQITRPPRMGHDVDVEDDYDPTVDTSMCDCGHEVRYCECPINDEPGLTDDELVAVRGLISQPRCARCDSKLGEAATVSDIASGMFCSSRCQKAAEIQQALTDARKSFASNHTGTAAEAPSEACEHSPAPAEGRPTSALLTDSITCLEAVMQSTSPDRITWHFEALVAELRDRAATFKAIEE